MKRLRWIIIVLLGLTLVVILKPYILRVAAPILLKIRGKATVADRVGQVGRQARSRLDPHFAAAGVPYPPTAVVLVGLKEEKRLDLYAGDEWGHLRFVTSYPILAASGTVGPKLREGDCQVPEGVYRIDFLNPNSLFHLSLHVSYPNEFDREMAAKEGRKELGGEIMIHGNSVSIGCLAMGDTTAEDLFVLSSDTGVENIRVILSPVDFRYRNLSTDSTNLPQWTGKLYARIKGELEKLPRPKR
jgi:L,D-transpeptidase catalytic domain